MYGRMGHLYLLHLAEASAQRRRINGSAARRPASGSAPSDLAILLRLLCVIGIALTLGTMLIAKLG